MPDYYFQGLSPHDFEALVQSLLQEELDIRLEAFTAGRDEGVDARYSQGGDNLIVQCKHYPHSNWSSLQRALQAEAPKVELLSPSRYIVATSMGLTPARKARILELFTPYLQTEGDILGRDDLNNLLGRHPSVERRHHKLWLTSIPVLTKILNANVYSEQRAELDWVQQRLSRFVQNPSVPRALDILEDNHFCVITGMPGIGKSTLAEMLLIDHLNRDYECFRVWESIDEIRAVLNRRERQFFYYDDFFGRTGLRHQMTRNEDERLLRLLSDVHQSENTRLVLTTREYILNQARSFMEGLQSGQLEAAQCIVALEDYSPQVRAEILYNHLYFSNLPRAHLEALLESRAYRQIVRHANYSPRILEVMTDALNVATTTPADYAARFLNNLDNPRRLWEIAYMRHLTHEAQDALLALVALPDRVRLSDAEQAFESLHAGRAAEYGYPRSPYDWQRALRELEGTFVRQELTYGELLLEFHNPSIRDFLEALVRDQAADLSDLIKWAVYCDGVARLWKIVSEEGSAVPSGFAHQITQRYWSLRHSPSAGIHVVQYSNGQRSWGRDRKSLIRRFLVLWDIVEELDGGWDILEAAASDVMSALSQPGVARGDLAALLERLQQPMRHELSWSRQLESNVVEVTFSFEGHLNVPDYHALAKLLDRYPRLASSARKDRLASSFRRYIPHEEDFILEQSDFDDRLGFFEELELVADLLDVPLNLTRERVEDEYDYPVRPEAEGRSHFRSESGVSPSAFISDRELDSLFGSLVDSGRGA